MKINIYHLAVMFGLAVSSAYAADTDKTKTATAAEKTFIHNAADSGMTEVALGEVAAKNGDKQDVKDFGSQMVKDHGKANDDLKAVASKLGVEVPPKVSAAHQAKIDKMSKMSGAAFDSAYVKGMVEAHEKDIAAFEKARGEVKNDDLKGFIDQTLPVMKHHLEMVKKMASAK